MYVQRNIEARSLNHCCRGKAISLNVMSVFIIASVIRHAKRMRRVILPFADCLIPPYFSSYLINGANFGKKNY